CFILISFIFFFFFSSRRRHTRFSRDWSSDVCSSDLGERAACTRGGVARRQNTRGLRIPHRGLPVLPLALQDLADLAADGLVLGRSEERRVGEEIDLGKSLN